MRRLFLIAALLFAPVAQATTWNVNTSSNLQTVINGTAAGDTVIFAAGTYNIGTPIQLKCGVTYTGPVISPGYFSPGDGRSYWGYTTQTAIMNSTMSNTSGNPIFQLYSVGGTYANPCTQQTVIEYFNFKLAGGVYVRPSFTNLLIQYNYFNNIPCTQCNSSNSDTSQTPGSTAIYFDGGQGTASNQILSSTTVQYNVIGDNNSCLLPYSSYSDVSSPDGDGNAGGCGGLYEESSTNGLTIQYNNFFHVSEGMHINACFFGGYTCEPPNAGVINNLNITYNDFSYTHRMDIEYQPQPGSGGVIQYNSFHDKLNTPGFSFGISNACCYTSYGTPVLNTSSNVIAWNLPPASGNRYGYGIEAWGNNANYNNNWLGISSNYPAAAAITWGWDSNCSSCGLYSVSNNTVCNGNSWGGQQYSVAEVPQSITPPVQTGNSFTTNACTAVTSVTPTLGVSGSTVTFTDNGFSSGPQPLGNTGIWYTSNGSTPIAGSNGTYIASGGTATFSGGTVVKALGMWGAQNQTTSYGSGLGFVPSAVATITVPGGGGTAATPTFSPVAGTYVGTQSVTISSTSGGAIICWNTTGSPATNGTTGCSTGTLYSSPVSVVTSQTLYAVAGGTGYTDSTVGSAAYVITSPSVQPGFISGKTQFNLGVQ